MTVINYNKKRPTSIDDVFNGIFPEFISTSHKNKVFPSFIATNHMNKGIPAVNTKESDKSYEIELVAPGINKDEFNINIDEGVLSVSYESETSTEEEKENYMTKEFGYSSFSRSFKLPDNVNGDKISAKYENGILKLELPKIKEAKKSPKMITVN